MVEIVVPVGIAACSGILDSFYFGKSVQTILGRYEHAEWWGLLVIVIVAVTFWLWHRRREQRALALVPADPED